MATAGSMMESDVSSASEILLCYIIVHFCVCACVGGWVLVSESKRSAFVLVCVHQYNVI